MNLKDTLNLPDPEFTIPMRANLPELEPRLQAEWAKQGIYEAIQESRKGAESFVLHDGPPYTNGPIHLGTALNKILKDFVVKSQSLMGKRAPYVPGYDNHGLPIEMAVQAKFAEKKVVPSIVELRKACREHAEQFIEIQSQQFQRIGVFGMWDKPYVSMAFRHEAEIARVFGRLVKNGYVYRGLRPVLWSPTAQTALADTEIVYEDVTSKSIYVSFPLKSDTNGLFDGFENVSCVIWTTTPWTIPANLAVAFHPSLSYALVRAGDAHYLVFEGLVDKVMAKCEVSEYSVVAKFEGSQIERTVFQHPVFGRDSLAVLADYVTTDDGTGVVHTAPGHGRDDFYTGKKYGLPALCPVDEKGVLTEEAGEFAGVFYKKCDTVVVDRLRELGHLLHVEDYRHSYPHAERDGKPVIFRATEQWFVGIDLPFHLDSTKTLRQRLLEEVERVAWFPANGKARMRSMIEGRPDWCVSRQRPWGVGIPVFYGAESGEPDLSEVAIESIARLIEKEGSDAWYEAEPSKILPDGYKHSVTGETSFRKEVDVFDVWFDSGSTWACVLEGNVESRWKEKVPCDLYLEGSDQHRGWFNVSLIIGTALTGGAPYDQVLTHGFLNTPEGAKLSKRAGNALEPVHVSNTLGADILRLWVASVDTTADVPVSEDILKAAGEHYRRIRNTMRFLLGNLYDYEGYDGELLEIDRWIVQECDKVIAKCFEAFASYDFTKVFRLVYEFCEHELSSFYLDAIKDRMYCDGKDWPSRRSGQRACHEVLVRLTKLVSPILMHTAEETYARIPAIDRRKSVFIDSLTPKLDSYDADLDRRIRRMLAVRELVATAIEEWKSGAGLKDTQDIDVDLMVSSEDAAILTSLHPDLAVYYRVASVAVRTGEPKIGLKRSEYEKCERSRVRRADVEPTTWNGETVLLSARDRRALGIQ